MAISQQVISGCAADGLGQALAEFLLQKTHHLAHPLQREAFAPQFADDRYFGQVFERVHAPVALASGHDNSALIPPLQLARGDTGQANHIVRCK